MKKSTLVLPALIALAMIVSSCGHKPTPTPFDRQLPGWKAGSGGVNPSKSHGRNRH